MPDHDPVKFLSGLSAKLATRSRHICAFLGAGTSKACGLPDVDDLKEKVLADLNANDRNLFSAQLDGRNLEEALSRLRRISALLTGDNALDGLTKQSAIQLDTTVCASIVKNVAVDGANIKPVLNFAAWATRAAYQLPLEVFTPNYDLLLETAFEALRVPYFDGFVGNLQARFHTDLVESFNNSGQECVPSFFLRLWKLHGSVNWQRLESGDIVRTGSPIQDDMAAAIYPSDTKYEESRRVPFVVLHDRLRRALQQPETLTIVTGYSFADAHLNELFFEAAVRRERSEFAVFCFAEIPPSLADRALVTPNLQVVSPQEAILGGVRGNWSEPEDAPEDLWSGGHVALGDFQNLARYLSRSTTRRAGSDINIQTLIKEALDSSKADAQDGDA